MLRQMMVSGLTIDPFTNSPIMILKDVDSDKAVPIWIGLLEATAIASELENIKFSRPMTHDLLRNIMESMEIKVLRVEVCDLRDNTYFALIHLQPLAIAPIFILGYIFAYLYRRSGSIWPAVIMHVSTNALGLGAAFLLSLITGSG